MKNGALVTATKLTIGRNLSLLGAGTILAAGVAGTSNTVPNVIVAGDIAIENGAALMSRYSTSTQAYFLSVSAQNLFVDSSSAISVKGQGYLNIDASNYRSLGNQNYFGSNASPGYYSGGSYGGEGGTWDSSYRSNATYGSFEWPIHLGTSGSCSDGTQCSRGGGSVRINVANDFELDGVVRADAHGYNGFHTGASGGSVLIQTLNMKGTGTVSAHGDDTTNRGTGGGGRIALYYTNGLEGFATEPLINFAMKAFPGNRGDTSLQGAAGTVYFKKAADALGSLSIDANNIYSTRARTIIPAPTGSTIGILASTTLSASNAFTNQYVTGGFLQGLFVNPKISQTATPTLGDDSLFKIFSNTVSEITTSTGNMTSVAANGDTFKAVLKLKNLSVANKARLSFAGHDILVTEGDIDSDDTTTFKLDGDLGARTVDVGGATWTNLDDGVTTSITTRCAANVACP